jgi:hypothetical protein
VCCEPDESLQRSHVSKQIEKYDCHLTLLLTSASAIAIAMQSPSLVLVPLPSSSMITLLDDQSKLVSFVAYFDVQAMLINIAEDEGCLAHFGRESRDIRFNTIVNRDPSKELTVNRKCHKLCWDTLSF